LLVDNLGADAHQPAKLDTPSNGDVTLRPIASLGPHPLSRVAHSLSLGRPITLDLHHGRIVAPEIAPASEFSMTLLGYEPKTPVIHEPTQTALVRFFALPSVGHYDGTGGAGR
jgi:hypothetical protein